MEPLTDVRDIAHIAYGFMASKVLFASLHLDLYSRLAEHPKTLHQLATETGIAAHRLLTLLTACCSLGLLTLEHETYRNAPASARYLVRGAPADFGDYFRWQVDRHVYPHLTHLDAALRGAPPQALYDLMTDKDEAAHFTRAQHAGSLGPAAVLAKMVNLSQCQTLLDVAGGSGALSIALCRRYPALRATLLDFPTVLDTAKAFVAAGGVAQQIAYLPGDALTVPWPPHQDVVLMSYLLSAVSPRAIRHLLAQAYGALRPGGVVLLHDFMVDEDRTGPTTAALWFTVFLSNPEAISFTPGWLGEVMREQGFAVENVREVIPQSTKLLVANKPRGDRG
jgi:2-hydroxy-4-(methylsulfanyl)butanoate S-methyltransferase